MLHSIGLESIEELFSQIPESIKLNNDGLNIPNGVSELEAQNKLINLANKY